MITVIWPQKLIKPITGTDAITKCIYRKVPKITLSLKSNFHSDEFKAHDRRSLLNIYVGITAHHMEYILRSFDYYYIVWADCHVIIIITQQILS